MSASPAQPPSGPNSVTPNAGGPVPIKRKKPPVNIFNTSRKKPIRKPPPPAAQRGPPPPALQPQAPNGMHSAADQQKQTQPAADDKYEEYSIVINRRTFEAGQRVHALKFQTRVDRKGGPTMVSPYEENHFARPLRLHRRYARDKMEIAESDGASGVDDKERAQMDARRAERQAEREENQKLIAPTGGDTGKPFKKKPQKKVEEGRDDSNPVRQKRQQLRYEEARPWHLEDFEGKNIWVGSYEEALSETSIMFEVQDGYFRMVPIEKWYKFSQVSKVNAMSSEEVEKHMAKKATLGRWAMGTQKANDANRQAEALRLMAERRRREDDDEPALVDNAEFQADRDMLDIEFNDEFQDDDEGMLYQGEEGEDGKEIEQRLWLEMRDAGLSGTGVKDEDIDPEEEERKKQLAEEEQKKKEKKLKKQLMKRENKGEYLSDDDSNPYEDSSEEEDSDEERTKDEEQKAEEAKKATQHNGGKSGASSRGTNTPSGRPEKRPNPDMSDFSGNESSRKKAKGLDGAAVSTTGGARSLSPDAARPKPKMPRSTGGSGSGSDTDTSRAGRPKLKLKHSPPGSPSSTTPTGSRATSPAATGSRAQSPKPNGAGGRAFPTLEEVRAAIPPAGIEIKSLVALFKPQVANRGPDFITLVKTAGIQHKGTGKIMPKS